MDILATLWNGSVLVSCDFLRHVQQDIAELPSMSVVSRDTPGSIAANFNGTALGAGASIWFSSVLKPSGLGTKAVTIFVRNSTITFSANGTSNTVPVPDANVTFSPSATSATTTFNTAQNLWQTTVPSSGLAGNILLDAAEFPVPPGGLPGGIQNVTWNANFSTDTSGISLQWQWGAAVYTSFSTDYNAVGVKPVDDNKASQYQNSDHAGTPENFRTYVTGGATGGGGSNYTGGLSGTASTTVAVNQIPTANPGGPYSGVAGQTISFSGAGSSDADGDPLTYSWSFGDGATATGVSPTHTYMSAGTFAVTLTVSDGRNGTGTASTTASVVLPAPPPPPTITAQISPSPNSKGWNNTSVTVSFSCSSSSSTIASCTSPITVSTQGANQVVTGTARDKAGNSATISVSLNIDLAPPTVTATAYPFGNASGWINRGALVTFDCSDNLSGVAICPDPQLLGSEGRNQVVSGTATDLAGNSSSASTTVNIDLTPPSIAITSPADGSVASGTSLTIVGLVSDSLSGVANVNCNEAPAAISAGSFSCGVTLVPGYNVISIQALDNAANGANSALHTVLPIALNPPPNAVFVTPNQLAMVVADSRQLSLVDNLGRTIPATSWIVSDPTVVKVALDGTITPIAPGKVAITGSYQNLSAQASVVVYSGTTLPLGTVQWAVSPLPGSTLKDFKPGPPPNLGNPGVPAAYGFELNSGGLLIRGFGSDGRQAWSHLIKSAFSAAAPQISLATIGGTQSNSTREHKWRNLKIAKMMGQNPDFVSPQAFSVQGASSQMVTSAGAVTLSPNMQELATATSSYGNQVVNIFERSTTTGSNSVDSVIVLDKNGNELWRHSIVGGEMGWALHPAGIVYVLQADYNNNSTFTLFAFDEFTGAQKFSIVLPFSLGGILQPFTGLPSVFPDGNLYLPVETDQTIGGTDMLNLLKVAPNGSSSWFFVASAPDCFGPVIDAHEPIPDGDSAMLITWDYFGSVSSCAGSRGSVQVTRMSTSGQILNKYALPATELASYFSDNDGETVISNDGTVHTTDRTGRVITYDSATGQVKSVWQPPPPPCTNCSTTVTPLGDLANQGYITLPDGDYLVMTDTIQLLIPNLAPYVTSAFAIGNSGSVVQIPWVNNLPGSNLNFWDFNQWLLLFQPGGSETIGYASVQGTPVKHAPLSQWDTISESSTRGSWTDTKEETVVGWIDASAVSVPDKSTVSPKLTSALTVSSLSCDTVLLSLLHGVRGRWINTDQDRQYVNAFLISNSGNADPGTPIDPRSVHGKRDYRQFNDFQARIYRSGSQILNYINDSFTTPDLGLTVDSCKNSPLNPFVSPNDFAPQAHPDHGKFGTSPSKNSLYQLAEGRVGDESQRINWVINSCASKNCNVDTSNYSQFTPWVWGLVLFDAQGNPTFQNQIFPTYSVYENGKVQKVIRQVPVETFIPLTSSSEFLIKTIP